MALSHELVSQFAKLVNQDKKTSVETTVYATVTVDANGNKYVTIDGSDQLTPIDDGSTAADVKTGERVSVLIKDHSATVTGNVSSPAARTEDVQNLGKDVEEVKQFDIVLAGRVQANEGYIKTLQTDKADVGELRAAEADIAKLNAEKASIDDLEAANAEITNLKTDKLDVAVADAKYATIVILDAANADIDNLRADYVAINGKLVAAEAEIVILNTKKLDAESAKVTYANIDFSNIKMAAVEELFTKSGIIKDLVVGDTSITGELVGVTLKGDLVEAGTLKADRLVVKGSDGNYYALNTDFSALPGVTPVEEDAIHGSVLVKKSIVADKIAVDDLVAFGATIGGFKITNGSETYAIGELVTTVEWCYDWNTEADYGDENVFLTITEIDAETDTMYFNNGGWWQGSGQLLGEEGPTYLVDVFSVGDVVSIGFYGRDGIEFECASVSRATVIEKTAGAIHSVVKESVNNTTRGFYVDNDGQMAVGDADNFIKYFKDTDGQYKLVIASGGKTVDEAISDIEDSVKTNTEDLTAFIQSTTAEMENLQGQIDGSIMTWFYEYVPTNDNIPASEWTTVALKNNHLGDLFYDTITGYCYRWQVQNNQYSWNRITDVDVTKALADAAKAQSTADGKRRVFVDTPKPPYDVGDLWTQGSSGDLMRCQTAKTSSQSYAAADWIKASKYTDDSAANQAQSDVNALKTRVTTAETAIEQSNERIAITANKVDKLEIGGRNLLLNSSFKENIEEWTTQGEVLDVKKTVVGSGAIKIDDASPSSRPMSVQLTSEGGSSVVGKNLFNPSKMLVEAGWVEKDGYLTGAAISLHQNYNTSTDGYVSLEGLNIVSISFYGYHADTDGRRGLIFYVVYDDDTRSEICVKSNTETLYTFTSDITKTVKKLCLSYGSNGGTHYLRDIQIEQGSNITPYVPYGKYSVDVGGKNLIAFPYIHADTTINGVTFAVNDDKSITVNGTATADASFRLSKYVINNNTYTLSGCPKGGSSSTYYLHFRGYDYDTGNGITFAIGSTSFSNNTEIVIKSGYTANNLTFYPQMEIGNKATSYSPPIDTKVYEADETGLIEIPDPPSNGVMITTLEQFSAEVTYSLESGFVTKYDKPCLCVNHTEFAKTKYVRQSVLGKLEPDTEYTLSGWTLAENVTKGSTNFMLCLYHEGVSAAGDNHSYGRAPIEVNAGQGNWKHVSFTFTTRSDSNTALHSNIYVYARDLIGLVYFYNLKLEKGNKVTDWTPAPEDTDRAIADSSNVIYTEISKLSASIEETAEGIQLSAEEINTRIDGVDSKVSTVESDVASLKVSAEGINARVESVETGEFDQVKVKGKNFKMDSEGFTVEDVNPETDRNIKTTISNNGMIVYDDDDPVLTANNEGVKAKNLHANTYLIIGKNSRFEDYANHTRTACFWIGN